MKKEAIKVAATVILSLLCFITLNLMRNGVEIGLNALLGLKTMENVAVVQGAILFLSGVFFVNVYQLLRNRISVRFIKIELILYFVLMFAVIMLKSPGVQEVNFDASDLYRSIIEYPTSVLLNILLFVPVGAVVFRYIKSMLLALGLALLLIVSLEAAQYVFRLGVTDIVDVILGMLGFAIGYLTLQVLEDTGFRPVRTDTAHVRIIRSQKALSAAEYNITEKKVLRGKAVVAASFLGTLSLLLVLGFVFYKYEPYDIPEVPLRITTDPTLNNLPLKPNDPSELAQFIEDITLFRINNLESSSDWIGVDEEGLLHACGRVSNYSTWLTEEEVQYFGVSLGIYEELGAIRIVHGIPLIVTPKTKIFLSGKEIGIAGFIDSILRSSFFLYELDAEFSLQDGWFKAEALRFQPGNWPQEIPYLWFDYMGFTQSTENIRSSSINSYIEIRSSTPGSIVGHVDVISRDKEMGNSFTLRINDIIGGAIICHTIEIAFEGEVPDSFTEKLSQNNSVMSFQVYVKNGRIVYAE